MSYWTFAINAVILIITAIIFLTYTKDTFMFLVKHDGNKPEGYDVTNTGTLIATRSPYRKYLAVVNTSDVPVYIALHDGETNQAVVGKGIYLSPGGGVFELNNTNMYTGDIWAIHEGAGNKRVCVQTGK